jgi:putative protein-disulfide isomerase
MSSNQPIRLLYLFDPLCGWCYAAAPALAAMTEEYGPTLEFMPSGLFAESGHARSSTLWPCMPGPTTNDQRIARMTGQPFPELYRDNVLARRDRPFDSGPRTLAMTAIRVVDPAMEAQFLHRAQVARYVEGRDTTDPVILAEIASGLRNVVTDLATRLVSDRDLAAATSARIAEAQHLRSQSARCRFSVTDEAAGNGGTCTGRTLAAVPRRWRTQTFTRSPLKAVPDPHETFRCDGSIKPSLVQVHAPGASRSALRRSRHCYRPS